MRLKPQHVRMVLRFLPKKGYVRSLTSDEEHIRNLIREKVERYLHRGIKTAGEISV